MPTLVIVGGYDWVCPPAGSRILAAGIPGALLAEAPAAGHFSFSEEPRAFCGTVRDFLSRTARGAGRGPDDLKNASA